MVETLERRGMLSATIGSLADQAVVDVRCVDDYAIPAETSQDVGDGTEGLPEGVSLLVCPVVNWAEVGSCDTTPTWFVEGIDAPVVQDLTSGVLEADELLACTGFPAPRFTLTETSDASDPGVPADAEGSPEVWQCGVDDPAVGVDPVAFDVIDVRVQFVSSDASWAAYYYNVGSDGAVESVSVVASYDEPTIAAFIADHRDDAGVEVFDVGDCIVVTGFPLELAPPVPERTDFWGWSDGIFETTVPDATDTDDGRQFTPEYQYDSWAEIPECSAEFSADGAEGAASSMSFASIDGQAVQRGFAVQAADGNTPRCATGAENVRPTGELAAAAMWLNISGSDAGGMSLPGGKRRSR